MSTKIGHFEILSELAKSATGTVYKANDPESGQTVALKAIQLSAFGDGAADLEKALVEEVESTKVLSSPNITTVFGAGEMDGQFCAAMEYVQGNSIATMLARKEGFSIWDLLDIGRQLCGTLDYAASQHIVHYSLEPGKIMCGWDGTVKILSFGVSGVGRFLQHVTEGVPSAQHYMSPEQILEQPMDGRSNMFSVGAIFYEMVTERKAFDRDDIASLRQSIVDSTPVAPIHVNPKVHPLLSELIMKALEKDPAQRYQTGRELLDDLEKCKESKPLPRKPEAPAPAGKAPAASPAASKPAAQAASAAGKTASAASSKAASNATSNASSNASPNAAPAKSTLAQPAGKKSDEPAAASAETKSTLAKPVSKLAMPKAAAAAAGAGSKAGSFSPAPLEPASSAPAGSEDEVDLDLSNQFITSCVKATLEATEAPAEQMSAAVADEPQVETFAPRRGGSASKIAVDPVMAGGEATSSSGTKFSDITELPPLKEVYIAPPPPPAPVHTAAPAAPTVFNGRVKDEEKPKVQPREVAEKAIKEIKSVPPKLMLYALGGAGALILAIGIGVTVYIHGLNSDDDSAAARPAAVAETAAPTVATEAAPAPRAAAPVRQPAPEAAAPTAEAAPAPVSARGKNARKKAAPAAAPAIIPGRLVVDSTPQGAQVQLDGRSDPSWVTPFTLPSLQPGAHSITVSKPGYSSDTRTVNVASGNQSTVLAHLAQLMATLVVSSDPAGANVYVDGRDTGAKTPAQVSVDKGSHVVLVRKMGFIDETMSAQFVLGQTFNFAPGLRPLGNVDSIKSVGKMSKLFGGKAQPGQAILSVHTQPKGAQVAINEHMMDKNSPLDVALDPGNYVVDITLSGYAPVHKVITADRGGKVVVDEVLQKQ
jgi:serine/threonine protein kinase